MLPLIVFASILAYGVYRCRKVTQDMHHLYHEQAQIAQHYKLGE